MIGNVDDAPAKESIFRVDASHDSPARGAAPSSAIRSSSVWHPVQSRMKRRLVSPSGRRASHAEAGAVASAAA
jgi:hypothetical protein